MTESVTPADPSPESADHASEPDHTQAVAELVAAHVSLSLLIDLNGSLDSHDIYLHEPGDADWLTPSSE